MDGVEVVRGEGLWIYFEGRAKGISPRIGSRVRSKEGSQMTPRLRAGAIARMGLLLERHENDHGKNPIYVVTIGISRSHANGLPGMAADGCRANDAFKSRGGRRPLAVVACL